MGAGRVGVGRCWGPRVGRGWPWRGREVMGGERGGGGDGRGDDVGTRRVGRDRWEWRAGKGRMFFFVPSNVRSTVSYHITQTTTYRRQLRPPDRDCCQLTQHSRPRLRTSSRFLFCLIISFHLLFCRIILFDNVAPTSFLWCQVLLLPLCKFQHQFFTCIKITAV